MPKGVYTHKKQSAETIAKRVAKLVGRKYPAYLYPNKGTRGKRHSEEHRRNIGEAHKKAYREGRLFLPSRKGTKWSPEMLKKLSEAHLGKRLPPETRVKISVALLKNARRGANHPHWRGGKASENELIRRSVPYKIWRQEVFKRDGYRCVVCNRSGGWDKSIKKDVVLNADHIKPFATHPELRLDVENGRTLCKQCHCQTDTFGWRLANKLVKRKI